MRIEMGTSYWDLVLRRAEAAPAESFLFDDRGGHLSFADYRDAAERAAAGLLELGVRPGQRVSWQLPTTLDAAVLLGALARLTVVQNPIIHILRRNEVGFIIDQLSSDWLITRGVWRGFDFGAMAKEVADQATHPVSVVQIDDGLPDGDPTSVPPFDELQAAAPSGAATWIYYSSGSTGRPKGALHTDFSVMSGSNAMCACLELSPDDVYPMAFPITHVGGITFLVAGLRTGVQTLLLEAFDPIESPKIMAAAGATMLGSALPFFNAYIAAQRQHGDEPLFPKLRLCASGGAPLPPDLVPEIKRVLGGAGVFNGWGLTEFPVATFAKLGDSDEVQAHTNGGAAEGVTIRVVALDGTEQPTGGEGELRVKGPQMLLGYVDPALNADAFDEQGFFRTGDLGIVDEAGNVRVTGRLKDIIIRNAENISAVEVENALFGHPAILDVAVVGLPDPRTGERACAVVQLAEGHTSLTLQSLAEHCRAQGLASQKIPEQLEIIDLLPRNPQGKILKHELRARLLED